MSEQDDPSARRRDINLRYNLSAKGQRRNRRYEAPVRLRKENQVLPIAPLRLPRADPEDKHPERKLRWEQARNAMRPGGAP